MTRITKGTIHLFTYKEGVLSAIAHDLRLTVNRFRIQLDGDDFTAVFMPDTIVVDGAVKNGALDERALSEKDKGKIRATMQGEVLRSSQFAKISYAGKVAHEGVVLIARGDLELAGKKRPLQVTMRRTTGRVSGEVEIKPSEWGIKPYRALGGTLKLQDRVRVTFDLPDP